MFEKFIGWYLLALILVLYWQCGRTLMPAGIGLTVCWILEAVNSGQEEL